MAVNPSTFGVCPQFELASGAPAVGNLLFFYAAGTTTKVNTFTSSTGATPNANPIVLNSLGQPPSEIWFTNGQSYKMVYAPSTDTDPPTNPIRTFDNLYGINDTTVSSANSEWILSPLTPSYVSATQFTVTGNQTATFEVGRRVKTSNTSGTVYSTITAVAFTTLTTVTIVSDSGGLDSGLSAVSYGFLSYANNSYVAKVATTATNSYTANAAGTADAITATFLPNISVLSNGLRVTLMGCSANGTTTPTLAAGTTAATTIVGNSGSALTVGSIPAMADLEYNSTYAKWVLLNPSAASTTSTSLYDFRILI